MASEPLLPKAGCCGVYLDRAVNAAIDDDRLTGEVACLGRAEISTEIADFVRLSHSPHRNRFGESLELLIECCAQVLRSGGKYLGEAISHDRTRRNIVDGDTVRCEIRRNGFGHDRNTRANRIRDDEIGQGLFHAVASEVDDTAATRSLQSG